MAICSFFVRILFSRILALQNIELSNDYNWFLSSIIPHGTIFFTLNFNRFDLGARTSYELHDA